MEVAQTGFWTVTDGGTSTGATSFFSVVPVLKISRMTDSKASLSAGFWKNALAPMRKTRSRARHGSRPESTITGMVTVVAMPPSHSRTLKPSPAGRPMSRMIRSGTVLDACVNAVVPSVAQTTWYPFALSRTASPNI